VRVPVVTITATVPVPVPEAGLSDNQVVLSFALQLKVPPPALLMVKACAAGLPPPCWAIKDRLVGLVPIAGLTETTGTEGGESNCSNPAISAANFFIDRPPVPPFFELDELPAPAAASGIVPVVDMAAAMDPVAVADDGATLMVARGRSDDGSLD
jgi:hypothetical protein